MKILDLRGPWRFRALRSSARLSREHRRVTRWMKASVPGTVHTDLMAAGEIPDPFYGTQELDVQWVEEQRWVYRKTFRVTQELLEEDRIELVAEGLDTYATVRCNGRSVGRAANMYIAHRFDLGRHLREGANTLEIVFDSPTLRAKTIERSEGALRVALEPHRVYVRKAQYSFGWDWGPKLTTTGIWRGIRIEAYSGGRLHDPWVKILSLNASEAVIRVSAEVAAVGRRPLDVTVFVSGGVWHEERETRVLHGRATVTLRIPNPRLWWPNGYGPQPMYTAVLTLRRGIDALHEIRVPFALRTVRLRQERDRQGKSFIVEINGKKIFCKGADWIPADSFLPRVRDSKYEILLAMARDAHMNMIRVWGGGVYEADRFYDLCDRLGLMVWQDFMFACGEYPSTPWFLAAVRREAENVVRRLRNHPSLVLWCGNNECEWLFCKENPGKGPDAMTGSRIFRNVLPDACRRHDGTRPYWRSSPFGEGFPNDERTGNHHQWRVWSEWIDYPAYEHDVARFVTEFGFQAPAHAATLGAILPPQHRFPLSRGMEHHNKQIEGMERLFRFQAAHHRIGETLEDFVYKGQLVQAEALKTAVEHWRRRKFRTAGALFWQLNDCWPVSSWSVIDSGLRPKAAYFYAKRFFAPQLVSFRKAGEDLEVWVTNDALFAVEGSLSLALLGFTGRKAWVKHLSARAGPNSSRCISRIRRDRFASADSESYYLRAQWRSDGKVLSENRFFCTEPKFLHLPVPRLRISIHEECARRYRVSIATAVFVKGLWIDFKEGNADDNFFDLDPGSQKEILVFSGLSLEAFRRSYHVKHC